MPSHWIRRHPTDRSIQGRDRLSQRDLGGFPFQLCKCLLLVAQIQRSAINVGSLNDLLNQIRLSTISLKDFQTYAAKLQEIGDQ